ncbi:MAG: hypothetical protein A4E66_00458 [Syntrophus sp. PtaB.Bin001]|nr:MAG: hypothetical protein A4E66_00458 [Syntrophus sp. PtaB.Bin001]
MKNRQMKNIPGCQLPSLPVLAEGPGFPEIFWQRRNRIRRVVKRRLIYFRNFISDLIDTRAMPFPRVVESEEKRGLKTGDRVRVRSAAEIRQTLDHWNSVKGCSFMEEMWPYCDTEQTVLKEVKRFLDERDYLIKKCSRIVILDGVMCQGTRDFGACDRSCFFFWREEWLEKVK